jgi:hypothetical protein
LYLSPIFSASAAKIVSEKVYRVGNGGGRHYQRGSNGRVYKSLTTAMDAVVPKSKILTSWRDNMAEQLGSSELADEYVQHTADYGTLLHIAVADFIRDGSVYWYEKRTWFEAELMQIGLKDKALTAATNEIVKDLAAMVQFFFDYRVDVIAVELPVFMDCGIATLVDLVVMMDSKANDQEPIETANRHRAIINLKSGKKGFFETHVLQLEGERRAFNETFSDSAGYKIERVYNLAPSNWRKEPTYKLKEQTDGCNAIVERFSLYVAIAENTGILSMPTTKYPVLVGKTEIGANPSLNIKFMGYDEVAAENIKINDTNNKES